MQTNVDEDFGVVLLQAVQNYMRLECKCHGLSGSCTLRTCWSKMPPFRDIGNRLKEHFDGAIKVLSSNDGRSFMAAGDPSIKPPGKEDIVSCNYFNLSYSHTHPGQPICINW